MKSWLILTCGLLCFFELCGMDNSDNEYNIGGKIQLSPASLNILNNTLVIFEEPSAVAAPNRTGQAIQQIISQRNNRASSTVRILTEAQKNIAQVIRFLLW